MYSIHLVWSPKYPFKSHVQYSLSILWSHFCYKILIGFQYSSISFGHCVLDTFNQMCAHLERWQACISYIFLAKTIHFLNVSCTWQAFLNSGKQVQTLTVRWLGVHNPLLCITVSFFTQTLESCTGWPGPYGLRVTQPVGWAGRAELDFTGYGPGMGCNLAGWAGPGLEFNGLGWAWARVQRAGLGPG